MTTYRTGRHHGVTIVEEGARCLSDHHDCARGHLAAVVVDGGQGLAERICALLNGDQATAEAHRFPVDAVLRADGTAGLEIRCIRCPWLWSDELGEVGLAELNRRAAEHAEVCG